MKIVISGDTKAELTANLDVYFDARLGPAIAADAYRFCPKDTEDLADSIEHHLEGHKLIVSATGSSERDYAAYVELGHRVAHGPGMSELGPKVVPPQPFLRASLFVERD